jgi:hypothetical protein
MKSPLTSDNAVILFNEFHAKDSPLLLEKPDTCKNLDWFVRFEWLFGKSAAGSRTVCGVRVTTQSSSSIRPNSAEVRFEIDRETSTLRKVGEVKILADDTVLEFIKPTKLYPKAPPESKFVAFPASVFQGRRILLTFMIFFKVQPMIVSECVHVFFFLFSRSSSTGGS